MSLKTDTKRTYPLRSSECVCSCFMLVVWCVNRPLPLYAATCAKNPPIWCLNTEAQDHSLSTHTSPNYKTYSWVRAASALWPRCKAYLNTCTACVRLLWRCAEAPRHYSLTILKNASYKVNCRFSCRKKVHNVQSQTLRSWRNLSVANRLSTFDFYTLKKCNLSGEILIYRKLLASR